MVGDYDQTINDFRHLVDYSECSQGHCCDLPPECKPLHLPAAIKWYNTYCLDTLTIKWLEDLTGKRMFGHQKKDEVCTLKWSDNIIHKNTLTICRLGRLNFRMTEYKSSMEPSCPKISTGDARNISHETRKRFEQHKPNNARTDFILELQQSGKLQGVTAMLQRQNISLSLCNVNSGNFLAVTIVHQIKGFECDHVAVHHEFIQCAEKENMLHPVNHCERNCLLLPFS